MSLALSEIPVAPVAGPQGVRFPGSSLPLVVAVTLNTEPKGERFVRMAEAGAFLLKREDVEEFMGRLPAVPVYLIEGEAYVALRELPGLKAVFDEKTLELAITLPPEELPRQRFDLATPAGSVDLNSAARSAMFNYRLGYAGTGGSSGNLSLGAEAAIAWGSWLLRNQSFHSRSSDDSSSIRLETQAIRDDRENLRRLTLGDSVTPGLLLGSSVPIAGITLAKAYQLEPFVVRQPAAGYRGIAEFPSQVDFYVGNTLVMRQQVAPGPFDIQNFTYYGGRRDVRVVIRDAFGREQTIAYPFYFSNQGLAAGLHDYSYQIGWLRNQLGLASNDYGRAAFSAFHQYGFSDAWTLGLRSEGTARMMNAGPDVFFRSEHLGLWSLHLGASRDRDTERNGSAVSFAHTFQREEFSSQVVWQRFSRDYAILHTGIAPPLPLHDFNATLAYGSPAFGSLSVGYTRLELPEIPVARSVNLSYSRPLFDRLSLTAIFRRQLDAPRGNEIFVGLQYIPQPEHILNLTGNRDIQGVKTTSLSWSNQIPQGEGVTYALNAQVQQSAEGTSRVLAPRVDWYARSGVVTAEVTQLQGPNSSSSTGYSLALAGSLVSAGGHFIASRPIADSFAIVEVVPPLAGVRVYENSQEVGRTDARGRVLLPNIASYARNYASIQDKDVPIDMVIDSVGHSFAPSLRSGTVVPFRMEQLKGYSGHLRYRVGGEARPLEYHLMLVPAGTKTLEAPTGKNGDFYVENLPVGRNRARVKIRGRDCEFILDVPDSKESLVSLGDVMTCDAAP